MALVVAAAAVVGFVRARRSGRPVLRRISTLLIVLVTLQVALGGWTVLSKKDFRIATAHVVTGALLLGTSLTLALVARRRESVRRAQARVFPMPLAGRRGSPAYPLRRVR
jgi:heme A synthase